MDLFGGLRSEIFRPLVTLVIPGAIATSPWWGVLFSWFPDIRAHFAAQPSAAWVIVLGTALAAGLVLENLGSRIEVGWDRLLDKRSKDQHTAVWQRYLCVQTPDHLVASRYLRTILLRLKFELSMAPALFLASIGLLVWHFRTAVLGPNYLFFCFAPAAACIYFLFESYDSARVLSSTRSHLIASLDSRRRFE